MRCFFVGGFSGKLSTVSGSNYRISIRRIRRGNADSCGYESVTSKTSFAKQVHCNCLRMAALLVIAKQAVHDQEEWSKRDKDEDYLKQLVQ